MTRSPIRVVVVAARIEAVRRMLAGIATLPLTTEEEFLTDARMVAAGESFLRRALEGLFDLARHILAKGFAIPTPGYKETVRGLLQQGIVDAELARKMTEMASRLG